MKKSVTKAVHSRFGERLKQIAPQFEEITEGVAPGCRLYRAQLAAGLWAFLHLSVSRDGSSFNVEVAWSNRDNLTYSSFPSTPADKPVNGELRFALPLLWMPPAGVIPSWELRRQPSMGDMEAFLMSGQALVTDAKNEVLKRVDSQVEDCIGRVRAFAIPYFEQLAQQLTR